MARVENPNRRGFLIGAGLLGAGAVAYAADLARRKFIHAISSGASIPAAPEPGSSAAPATAPTTVTNIPFTPTEVAPAVPTIAPTVEPSATKVPPTATAVPSPTAENTRTATTVPAKTVEASPTSEPLVIKDWKVYGPGFIVDEQTNEKRGLLVLAGLPGENPTDPHRLLAYFGEGNGSFGPNLFTQKPTSTNSFEGSYWVSKDPPANLPTFLKGKLGNDMASGEIFDTAADARKLVGFNNLKETGTGLSVLLQACAEAKAYAANSGSGGVRLSEGEMLKQINGTLQQRYHTTLPPYKPS